QRSFAALAVVAPFHEFADDEIGVVVAFLRPGGELAGFIEKRRHARHAISAIEREFERPRGVERELEAGAEINDAQMILDRIQRANLVDNTRHEHPPCIHDITTINRAKSPLRRWSA